MKFVIDLKRISLGFLILMISLSLTAPLALASSSRTPQPAKEYFLKEAQTLINQDSTNRNNLLQALSILQGNRAKFPNEIRIPLYMAEIYYRLADPTADVNQEFNYYEKTGEYAKQALKMDPNRPEGHYWYGLYLLKLAQKKGLRGYYTAKEGIQELERVRKTMPDYDHAGASRVLGLLYSLAPSWSPFGNLDKSIELGKEATRLDPDFGLNRLYLADAYKKNGDREDAIREYRAIVSASAHKPGKLAACFSQKAQSMLRTMDTPM
jgi:tetratricopeptide (TPR) repeat protein